MTFIRTRGGIGDALLSLAAVKSVMKTHQSKVCIVIDDRRPDLIAELVSMHVPAIDIMIVPEEYVHTDPFEEMQYWHSSSDVEDRLLLARGKISEDIYLDFNAFCPSVLLDYACTFPLEFNLPHYDLPVKGLVVTVQPHSGKNAISAIGKAWHGWKRLVQLTPEVNYILLGCEQDLPYVADLNDEPNVLNLVGKTSIKETCSLISQSDYHISIESWSGLFAASIGKQNLMIWQDEVLEIFLDFYCECEKHEVFYRNTSPETMAVFLTERLGLCQK